MADCGKISKSLTKNCTAPIQGGSDDRLILINYSDWKAAVKSRNVLNAQIIEGIAMASGAIGYTIEGQNNSNQNKNSMKKGKYKNTFIHEVMFIPFSKDASVKQQLELMAQGRLVAVVENNYKGNAGESAFEVYGGDAGLLCTVIESDSNNADTDSAYSITLSSVDPSTEPHLPATIFLTDYNTTKAIVNSIL